MTSSQSLFELVILCGGTNLERGISLNSARSVVDHLQGPTINIQVGYQAQDERWHWLAISQLYSNTPEDFDFKWANCEHAGASWIDFSQTFAPNALVFPIIHGRFGEDGQLQYLLEQSNIPFVGSGSTACQAIFDKEKAHVRLVRDRWPTIPMLVWDSFQADDALKQQVDRFWQQHVDRYAVLKPTVSGSSLGVSRVDDVDQVIVEAKRLQASGFTRVMLEPVICGREFTIMILSDVNHQPVALLPTEIVMHQPGQLFDYRSKYLPSDSTSWYCPARFKLSDIQAIRQQAERLFTTLLCRDVMRIDGWLLPDGTILWRDFNPISGMEQSSFLFQQAARMGWNHRQVLYHVISSACRRYHLSPPVFPKDCNTHKQPLWILMGGDNPERQISLLSGINVWTKLQYHPDYQPIPLVWDGKDSLYQPPYAALLNHTVEEVIAYCQHMSPDGQFVDQQLADLGRQVAALLGDPSEKVRPTVRIWSVHEWLKTQKHHLVFLALHGGDGENGTWQKRLEHHQIVFNGSDSRTSQLCMNKHQTATYLNRLAIPDTESFPDYRLQSSKQNLPELMAIVDLLQQRWQCHSVMAKPCSEGSSYGLAVLKDQASIEAFYATWATYEGVYLLQPFLAADRIAIAGQQLSRTRIQGWLECTACVLETDSGWCAWPPSITVAEGHYLSLEEKFQGGTGINLTPPPAEWLDTELIESVQARLVHLATQLSLRDYARIDFFVHDEHGKMIILEVNTLPALTPSTVLFQQGYASKQNYSPKQFFLHILRRMSARNNCHQGSLEKR